MRTRDNANNVFSAVRDPQNKKKNNNKYVLVIMFQTSCKFSEWINLIKVPLNIPIS